MAGKRTTNSEPPNFKVPRQAISREQMGNATIWHLMSPVYFDNRLAVNGTALRNDADRYLVNNGKRVSEDIFDLFSWIISDDSPAGDLLGNNLGWIFASDRTRACFDEDSEEIQWIAVPESVVSRKKLKENFWLANFLKIIPGIDLKHSKVRWSKNAIGRRYIGAIHRLVVKRNVSQKVRQAFCLAEAPPYILFCDSIVRKCRRARIKDFLFQKTDPPIAVS